MGFMSVRDWKMIGMFEFSTRNFQTGQKKKLLRSSGKSQQVLNEPPPGNSGQMRPEQMLPDPVLWRARSDEALFVPPYSLDPPHLSNELSARSRVNHARVPENSRHRVESKPPLIATLSDRK